MYIPYEQQDAERNWKKEQSIGRRNKTLKKCTSLGLKKDYGSMIKDARLQANVSQKELSEAIGYKTATAISLIESGKRDIAAYMLDRIIEVLGLKNDYFVSKLPTNELE